MPQNLISVMLKLLRSSLYRYRLPPQVTPTALFAEDQAESDCSVTTS